MRDICPEIHKQLEWQGQELPWNSAKWRQQSLKSEIVANVDEAYDVAKAALPVFEKVLNEVSRRFHFIRSYSLLRGRVAICRCGSTFFLLQTDAKQVVQYRCTA